MRNWKTIKEYEEILFDEWQGIARITINRPQVRNAFTPRPCSELLLGDVALDELKAVVPKRLWIISHAAIVVLLIFTLMCG